MSAAIDEAGALSDDETARYKRLTRLQSLLALRGFAVYELAVGGFLIAAHNRAAHAPDLRSLQAFLETVQ